MPSAPPSPRGAPHSPPLFTLWTTLLCEESGAAGIGGGTRGPRAWAGARPHGAAAFCGPEPPHCPHQPPIAQTLTQPPALQTSTRRKGGGDQRGWSSTRAIARRAGLHPDPQAPRGLHKIYSGTPPTPRPPARPSHRQRGTKKCQGLKFHVKKKPPALHRLRREERAAGTSGGRGPERAGPARGAPGSRLGLSLSLSLPARRRRDARRCRCRCAPGPLPPLPLGQVGLPRSSPRSPRGLQGGRAGSPAGSPGGSPALRWAPAGCAPCCTRHGARWAGTASRGRRLGSRCSVRLAPAAGRPAVGRPDPL